MSENQELYHYGVLGMKWGVRRGKAEQAYGKAKKKLAKLDARVEKRAAKLDKATDRYDRVTTNMFVANRAVKTAKAQRKLDRATRKYKQAVMKGTKWCNAMEKTFAETNIKFDKEVIDSGKRYAEIREARRISRLG